MLTDKLLADRYRFLSLLGRGGMGSIWLANDEQKHRKVVVKLISRYKASNPVAVTRFLREMRTHALTVHPHIVEVLDRGVDATVGPYLVLEKLEGADLEQHIKRTGPLKLTEIAEIAKQIGSAVESIHRQGFVHRDIKPSNVYLSQCADMPPVAKLLDFGAVKADVPLRHDGSCTAQGTLIGTLSRMSPEQLQGDRVDGRADIWGFALLIYELAVGTPAMDPEASMGEIVVRACSGGLPRPGEVNGALPDAFDAWFAKSTQTDPGDRYSSIREQVEALLDVCVVDAKPAEASVYRIELERPVVDAGKPSSALPTMPAPPRLSLSPPRQRHRAFPVASVPGITLLPPDGWPPSR